MAADAVISTLAARYQARILPARTSSVDQIVSESWKNLATSFLMISEFHQLRDCSDGDQFALS